MEADRISATFPLLVKNSRAGRDSEKEKSLLAPMIACCLPSLPQPRLSVIHCVLLPCSLPPLLLYFSPLHLVGKRVRGNTKALSLLQLSHTSAMTFLFPPLRVRLEKSLYKTDPFLQSVPAVWG